VKHVENGIIEVTTPSAAYRAHNVCLCMGPWVMKFVKKTFNVSIPLLLEVNTVNYWHDTTIQRDYSTSRGFPCVMITEDANNEYYAIPSTGSGSSTLMKLNYFCGVEVEPDLKDTVDTSTSPRMCSKFIMEHLLGLDGTKPAKTENCTTTSSPDDNLIVDKVAPNVFVATGFSGHGFKLAPVVGRMLADFVCKLEDRSPYPLEKFSLKRFKNMDRFVQMHYKDYPELQEKNTKIKSSL